MTIATFTARDNSFDISVDGHAEYNPGGPDIVCAACSTLCCALAQSVLEMDARGEIYKGAGFTLEDTPGHFKLAFTAHTWAAEKARTLFDHTLSAFRMIAEQYPQNVSLKTAGKSVA